MKQIIYKTEDGVAIISPSPEALLNHTIEEVAEKDVPKGKPYAIVDNVSSDRTFRNAWEIDEALLIDGVGSASSEFNKGAIA